MSATVVKYRPVRECRVCGYLEPDDTPQPVIPRCPVCARPLEAVKYTSADDVQALERERDRLLDLLTEAEPFITSATAAPPEFAYACRSRPDRAAHRKGNGMSDGLLTALLAVQSEAPTLKKDATNPAFRAKYTPLDTIVETIGPILAKHGLVWTTLPGRDSHGDPALTYRLAHAETGKTIEGSMPLLLVKSDPQGLGSAITYARRYALCAVLNLVADDDDDGNSASAQTGAQGGQRPAQKTNGASDKQIGLIKGLARKNKVTVAELRNMIRAAGAQTPEDQDVTGWLAGLSGRQASALIDVLNEPTDTPEEAA